MKMIDPSTLVVFAVVYCVAIAVCYSLLNWCERGSTMSRMKFNKATNFGISLFWWALAIMCVSAFVSYYVAKVAYILTRGRGSV